MAHVELFDPHPEVGAPAVKVVVDNIDYSMATYADGVELVKVGDDPATQEVGVRITFALDQLTINGDPVELTENFDAAAARVAAVVADDRKSA